MVFATLVLTHQVAFKPASATANVTSKAVVATSVNTATGTSPKRIPTVVKCAVATYWALTRTKAATSTAANASANDTSPAVTATNVYPNTGACRKPETDVNLATAILAVPTTTTATS